MNKVANMSDYNVTEITPNCNIFRQKRSSLQETQAGQPVEGCQKTHLAGTCARNGVIGAKTAKVTEETA